MANQNVKLPNFLIVGAAKSGTTSLWRYLSEHPEIFMSKNKEPKYFIKDLFENMNPKDPFYKHWEKTIPRNLKNRDTFVRRIACVFRVWGIILFFF